MIEPRLGHDDGAEYRPSDEAYFNPWMATGFVAIWMSLMLDPPAPIDSIPSGADEA